MKKWTALILCILAVFVLFTAAQADPEPEPEEEPYIHITAEFGEEGAEYPFLPLWDSSFFQIETNAAHNEEVLFFYDEGADPIPVWVDEEGFGQAWFTPGTVDCNIFEYTESYNAENMVHTYYAYVETMAENPADVISSKVENGNGEYQGLKYQTGLIDAEAPAFTPTVTGCADGALRRDDVFSATVTQDANFQNMCIVLFDEEGEFAADSHWVGVDQEPGADPLTIEVPLLRLEINKHYTAKIYALKGGYPMVYAKDQNGREIEYDVLVLSPSSQDEDSEIMIRGLNEEYLTGELILPTVYYPNSEEMEDIQMEIQVFATRYEDDRRSWDSDLYVWPNEGETDLYYQPEIWDNPISSWNAGEHVFRVIVWQRQQDGDEFVEVDSTERTFMVTSEGLLPNPLDLPVVLYEKQLPYTIEIERPEAEYFIIAAVAWDTRDGNFISSWEYSEWSEEEKFEITVDRADQCIEFYVEIGKQGYDPFRWAQRIPVIRTGDEDEERIFLETEKGLDGDDPLPLHTDIPLWVSAPGADWIRVENVYGEFFREDDSERINNEPWFEFHDSIREVGTNPIIATAQFTDDEGHSELESAVLLFKGYADGDAGDFTASIDAESVERGEPVTVTYTKSEHADHYWTDVDVWIAERQNWEWITHQADLNGSDGGTATLSTIELEPGAVYRFRALAESEGYRTAEYIITENFTVRGTEIPESGILVRLDKDEVETCEDVIVSAYAPGADWMEVYWDYGNNNWIRNNDGGESRTWNHSYGHAGSHEIRVKAVRTERDENGEEIWDHDDEGNEWPVQIEWWSDPVYVTITAPNGSLVLEAPELPDSYAPSDEEEEISFTVKKPALADSLSVSAWFDGEERDLYRGETEEKKLDVSFSTELPEGRTLQISIHAEKQGYDSADLTLSIPVLDPEGSDLVELSVGEGEITFDSEGLATVPIHGNAEFLVGAAEGHTLAAVKLYGPNGWWGGGDEGEVVTPENHGDWFRNGKAFFWTDFGNEDNIGRKVPVYALAQIDEDEEWVRSQVLWVSVLDHQIGSYSFTGETSVTAARGEDVEFTFTPARGADDYWVDAWDINNMWDSFQPESFWDGTKVTMSTASLPEGEYIVRGRAGADGKGWRESENSVRLTVTASTVPNGEVRLTVNKTEARTEEDIYASAYAPGADWIEIIRKNEEGRDDEFANDGGEGTSGRFSDGYPQTYRVFARAHYFERDDEGEPISEGTNEWGEDIWKELPWRESEIVEVRIIAPYGRIELNASGIPAYVIVGGKNQTLHIPYPDDAEYMDWELYLNRNFNDDEQEPDKRGSGAFNLPISSVEIEAGNTIELRVGAGATGYEHNHQDYQIRVIEEFENRITLTVSKGNPQVNEDFTVTITVVDESLNLDYVQYYDGERFRSFRNDGHESEDLPLDENGQWIFDEENFNEPGVRMMYARAWIPDENEEDGGYWLESDPVKVTLTRTGTVGEFSASLQKATVVRGETAVVNYTVADHSIEECYELHHNNVEEWVDYRLDWFRDDDKHQFTFSTAGMPAGEYRLRVWARGMQGYEGQESSSIWLTVSDSGIPEGEVQLFIDKTEALTNEEIAVGALAPGADWIEIIRRYEDGRENAFADNGGDSTSGTMDENHAETLEVFARAHYFKRDENGDPISTGTNDQGDDIWEELPYVNSEIVEVTFTAPYGRIEQNASGIPAYAVEGTDLNLRMPYPPHAEYMNWELYLNRDFEDDEQEPDERGSGAFNLPISGDEIEAGNTIELRVWVGGRGYEHNHQNYRIRVIAGHENNISLAVDKPTVQVNEKLSVTITVNRELEEGERVRYYNGNNFWSYGWDNYDLELDENRRWINNDESFGGSGVVMLYACIIPEGEDENEAAWTISDPVKVTVTRAGTVGDFTVNLQPTTVTRGETVTLNYTVAENSDEENYDLHHDRERDGDGEEWIDYNLRWHRDDNAHQFTFSTADMPAGVYRLNVFAGGIVGYEGRDSRTVFLMVEDPVEPTVAFEVSKSTVMTNEDLQAGVYAPGADRTEIFWHEDDIWRQDGDSWTGTYRYGNSGTYQVFARAWYPEVDEQDDPVYADSDRITITVTSNGRMIPLDLSNVPARFFDRTSATIVVDKPDESDYMGWEIWIDGEMFADHNSSESESINKNIPGGKLHEDGTVQLKVWTGAVGYDNNYQELRIPVVRQGGGGITFATASDSVKTCEDIVCTAGFPAGKYSQIQLFNGDGYEPEEDIGNTETGWQGSTSFGINGTYTLYARLWSIEDYAWVYTDEAEITVTAPNGPLTLDVSGIPAQLFAGRGATFSFGEIKDQNGAPVNGAQVNYQLYYEEGDNRTDLITWEEAKDETVTISSDEIVDGRVFRLDYNVFQEGYEPVLGGVDIPVVAAPTVTLSVDRKTVTYGEGVTFTVNAPGAESVQVRRWENDQPGGEIVLEGSTWTADEIGTIRFCATATYDGFDDLFISAQPVSVTVRTAGPAPAPSVDVPESGDEGAQFDVYVTPAAGGWATVSIFDPKGEEVRRAEHFMTLEMLSVNDAWAGVYRIQIEYGKYGYDDAQTERSITINYWYTCRDPEWTWAEDFSTATATFTTMRWEDEQEIPAQITSVVTEPTCDAAGEKTYTATATFQNRDYTDVQTETLAKKEHDWSEPVFTWSETGSGYSATATFTCRNFPAHTRTETAEVTLIRMTDATCTEPEKMVYRAVCEGYRENKTFTGADELGHDWEWGIVWNYDYTAYAERECGRCGETETAEADVVSTVTKEATCSARGEITYTASATLPDGQEITSSKKQFTPKTAHTPGEPAFSEDYIYIYTHCSVCGAILKAEEHGIQHLWSKPEYVWADDYSSVTATRTCGAAAALSHDETETAATEAEVIASPTDKVKGKVRYTAEFTNEAFTTQTKTVDIPTLAQMNTLKLPSGLKVIESEAFSNLACQAVIIQDGCTAIGDCAFKGCVNLKYVRIPASVPKDSWLENNAFEDCSPDLVIDYAGD